MASQTKEVLRNSLSFFVDILWPFVSLIDKSSVEYQWEIRYSPHTLGS